MTTRLSTKKRRSHQMLWTELDRYLSAHAKDGVILAVSGGPDSRALLESIASWPGRFLGRFIVATIDHGLRPEATAESNYIAMRAKRLGFDGVVINLPNFSALTGEHDLRSVRYAELRKIAKVNNCKVICTAHQRDDNAEGYLMAIMGCGGGVLGAAMEEVESHDGIILCRPFLKLSKNDLALFLTSLEIGDVVKDCIDEARIGRRAYVRHEIMPKLSLLAQGIKGRLSIFARNQRLQNLSLDSIADSFISWGEERAEIEIKQFAEKGLIIAAIWRVLKKWNIDKELRSCHKTILKIANQCLETNSEHSFNRPSLDPSLNELSLLDLSIKQYQLPGVLIQVNATKLIIRRIECSPLGNIYYSDIVMG